MSLALRPRRATLRLMFGLELWQIIFVFVVTFLAGFVKGVVGFAMPMVMMSAIGSILPAQTALAALILPTLGSNIWQAFRQGSTEALGSVRRFSLLIATMLVFIAISASLAPAIPSQWMFLSLGAPIAAYAIWQLSGREIRLPVHRRRLVEIITGIICGLYGGISGIWGPPLIVLLISLGVEKREQVRVQGVVFLVGAIMLTFSHLFSGILNAQTLPLSLALCVPAFLGMSVGFALQDRLDKAQFRRWTLILLVLSGLNLVRRAISIGF